MENNTPDSHPAGPPQSDLAKAVAEGIYIYEKQHPRQARQGETNSTRTQRFMSHWLTLVIGLSSFIGGGFALGKFLFDLHANVSHVPQALTDIAVLQRESRDFRRLTEEAKDHRDNREIHMSENEKKLLVIEANKPLELAVAALARASDKQIIEQREANKRQEEIVETLKSMQKKLDAISERQNRGR